MLAGDSLLRLLGRLGRPAAPFLLHSVALSIPVMAGAQLPSPPPSLTNAAARAAGLSGRILWMDATANLANLNSPEKARAAVDRAARAHVNSLVVDVKPIVGEVLFPSKVAPRLTEWLGTRTPADFDVLKTLTEEGHRRGLQVYASVNVFAEGHRFVSRGPAYQHPEWQAVAYDPRRAVVAPDGAELPVAGQNGAPGPQELTVFLASAGSDRQLLAGEVAALYDGTNVTALVEQGQTEAATLAIPAKPGGMLVGRGDAARWILGHLAVGAPLTFRVAPVLVPAEQSLSDRYALFVNPLQPDARRHELDLIEEIARTYPVDGVVFDRMRYPGLHADFSPLSRQAFEKRLGRAVEHWPEDVLQWPSRPGDEVLRGPLFRPWLEFRSATLRSFLVEAAARVRAARPGAQVGVYAGSWYEAYFDVGVNWGSPRFQPGYDWMSTRYSDTGYADQLDFLCSGTYYPTAWKRDAPRSPTATVEGSAEVALRAVDDDTFVYGSLYLQQYAGKPEAFQEAVRASLATTQGVMIFDMSHLDQFGWWPQLEEVLRTEGPPPHADSRLLKQLRAARAEAERAGGSRPSAPASEVPVSTDHPDL